MSVAIHLISQVKSKAPKPIKSSGTSTHPSLMAIKIPKTSISTKYPKLLAAAKTKKGSTKKVSVSATLKSLISKAKKASGAGFTLPSSLPSSAPPQPAFFGSINPNALL